MATLSDYNVFIYDCEVFAHDWLFVFKSYSTGEYTSFWNDADSLAEFVSENEEAVFAGFNSKHYDQYILKSILAGCEPEQVKEVNDWIVCTDNQPWEHPYLQGQFFEFHNTDLMDDMMKGTSLKSIEGHLGMNIEESSVDFTYTRKLTKKQRTEVEHYCKHDVDATEELLNLRKDYLETKLHLASLADVEPYKALGMTDPKLAAALFKAEAIEDTSDERDYKFPDRLDYTLIPATVINFFEQILDESVTDEELFSQQLEIEIGGCPVVYAFGGIHGALPKYHQQAENGTLILNYDVSSLYPSLMIEYGYVSRAVPDPAIFASVRAERFAAKKSGDKATANALKSPMNKAYGAMGNQYNPMYDPKMKLSVCVSGQLSITELAVAYTRIEGLRIIQLNTDGIMISCPEDKYDDVVAINDWWQKQTSLELEEDKIDLIWQKDVNNYVMRKVDGTEKCKGGYLVRGVSPIGAWSVNNTAVIAAEALKRFLLDGTPIKDTVEACNDPFKFQLIAKASHKYSEVYQLVADNSEEDSWRKVPVQKCNRVFACTDESLGRLYKVKAADGRAAKIESLPEHCLIYNDGMPSIEQIDKSYYIQLAEKRAQDFYPKEEEMAISRTAAKAAQQAQTVQPEQTAQPDPIVYPDYSKLNVYQKLAIARKRFLDACPKKSGMNDVQEYEYFELEDITPLQTNIFAEIGLLEQFTYQQPEPFIYKDDDGNSTVAGFTEAKAVSVVYNTDNPEQKIVFALKWGEVPPIISRKTGKEVNMQIQRFGGEQTYMRRYIKMQILDIVENDSVDSTSREEIEKEAESAEEPKQKAPSASKKPVSTQTESEVTAKPKTASERKSAAKSVTAADGSATALQLKSLKKCIKTVVDAYGDGHPEIGQYVAELSLKTNKLVDITKAEAESAIQKLGEFKAAFEGEE